MKTRKGINKGQIQNGMGSGFFGSMVVLQGEDKLLSVHWMLLVVEFWELSSLAHDSVKVVDPDGLPS